MKLEIREGGGRFPRGASSPSREGVGVGLRKQQMRSSHDAITAKRDSRVGDHPERSFYTLQTLIAMSSGEKIEEGRVELGERAHQSINRTRLLLPRDL